MKNGFIKVAAASIDVRVADVEFNRNSIAECMIRASHQGVKILVLPELCITSYTCGDLFFQKSLQNAATEALLEIAMASKGTDMLTFVGLPVKYGSLLYNCAAAVHNGDVVGIVPKSSLPNYSEFSEKRYFDCAPEDNATVVIGGKEIPFGTKLLFKSDYYCVAAEICEDVWMPIEPSVLHCAAGADIVVNLSASDESVGKVDSRRRIVKSQSARLDCGYIYASAGDGESTTDLVFGGHCMIAEAGKILAEGKLFENNMIISEIDVQKLEAERVRTQKFAGYITSGYEIIPIEVKEKETHLTRKIAKTPFVPEDLKKREETCEYILSIQSAGLKKRLMHTNAKAVVIGVSGGLDSTLAIIVAQRALSSLGRPMSDILAVTMPCFGTTKRTKNNALMLAQSIGATVREIDITEAVKVHFDEIGHDGVTTDVTYENNQARERTKILMDLANMTGGLVVGTGDLSELALGWATYNGDHMSMYGVNASIPKTLLRHIVKYEADRTENKVLYDILDTPVSPELLPPSDGEISQKTEDIVGPYELHDFFLYYVVGYGFTPKKVYELAKYAFDGQYDDETIAKWLGTFYRRFFSQQYKRSCVPDGPKVGRVALSPRGDWRMPSDAVVNNWMKEIDSL